MPRPRPEQSPTASWRWRCWRVSRRVSLPAADDLFRPTSTKTGNSDPAPKLAAAPEPMEDEAEEPTPRRKSRGRIRPDEKMTVQVHSDELLEIEHARPRTEESRGGKR